MIDLGQDADTYAAALLVAVRVGWTKAKVGDKTPPSRKAVFSALNDRYGPFISSENLNRSAVNAARSAFFERSQVWPKNWGAK